MKFCGISFTYMPMIICKHYFNTCLRFWCLPMFAFHGTVNFYIYIYICMRLWVYEYVIVYVVKELLTSDCNPTLSCTKWESVVVAMCMPISTKAIYEKELWSWGIYFCNFSIFPNVYSVFSIFINFHTKCPCNCIEGGWCPAPWSFISIWSCAIWLRTSSFTMWN